MIRGAGRVDARVGLTRRVNFCQLGKMGAIHGLVDRVTIEDNYEINVARGIGQRPLPEAFGIGWAYPGAVIFLVHYLTQWDAGLLHDAYVFGEVH